MTLPTNEPLPPAGFDLPPARRRRDRRQLLPEDENDRAAFLADLAKKVIPTGDFFIFSILSGMALCFAIFFDAPALYVLAALLAPSWLLRLDWDWPPSWDRRVSSCSAWAASFWEA